MTDVHPPLPAVREVVARALAEDLGTLGDLTGSLIPVDVNVAARVVTREDGVLAGRLCAAETFAQVDPGIRVTWQADDGDEEAHAAVLTASRTAARASLPTTTSPPTPARSRSTAAPSAATTPRLATAGPFR